MEWSCERDDIFPLRGTTFLNGISRFSWIAEMGEEEGDVIEFVITILVMGLRRFRYDRYPQISTKRFDSIRS